MTLRAIIAGAGTLTAGRALSQGLALVRHVIVGRLLSPDDLGIAAVLMVCSAMLELFTQFSVDKLLVQSRDGDDPKLQGAAQSFLAIRGIVVGVAAIALAHPIAGLFGVPEAAWAFAAFGAVPLIGGLRHLDCKRAHRQARFVGDMAVEVVPQVLVTALAWPILSWIGGYAGVVWLLVLKAALSAGMSHVVADRAYGWSWSAVHAKRIIAFGWPLLAGSAVMVLVTQGDQLIVGAGYSMRTLGIYAVAATLSLALATMIASISSTLMLPALSQRGDDAGAFSRAHSIGVIVHASTGLLCGAVLVTGGDTLITTLYGPEYTEAGVLLGLLGVMQAVRLMRVSPTVVCVSRGDTVGPLLANLCRAAALPVAVGVVAAGLGVLWIILAGVVGELLAVCVLSARAHRRHGVELAPTLVATGGLVAMLALCMITNVVLGVVSGAAAAGVLVAGAGALLYLARERWAKPVAAFRWIPTAATTSDVMEAA